MDMLLEQIQLIHIETVDEVEVDEQDELVEIEAEIMDETEELDYTDTEDEVEDDDITMLVAELVEVETDELVTE